MCNKGVMATKTVCLSFCEICRFWKQWTHYGSKTIQVFACWQWLSANARFIRHLHRDVNENVSYIPTLESYCNVSDQELFLELEDREADGVFSEHRKGVCRSFRLSLSSGLSTFAPWGHLKSLDCPVDPWRWCLLVWSLIYLKTIKYLKPFGDSHVKHEIVQTVLTDTKVSGLMYCWPAMNHTTHKFVDKTLELYLKTSVGTRKTKRKERRKKARSFSKSKLW